MPYIVLAGIIYFAMSDSNLAIIAWLTTWLILYVFWVTVFKPAILIVVHILENWYEHNMDILFYLAANVNANEFIEQCQTKPKRIRSSQYRA